MGSSGSKRLHIRDISSGLIYLIDTGSDISLFPAGPSILKNRPCDLVLYAANDSRVATYGERAITLNLNLRRCIKWNFCIAAVPYPIIGADLLAHFHLVPYLHESRLVDTTTGFSVLGFLKPALVCGLSTISREHAFSHILESFPTITSLQQGNTTLNVDIHHHILTTGPPVHDRARRLSPEKLTAAKAIFRQMVEDGICRPSSSPWATPIHMIKKKNGDWRVCGDFRRLNAITIPDRYPVPNLYDFASMLRGKKIFSKLDLLMAYHQIPIAADDIPKTAVITPFGLFEYQVMTFGLRNAGQTFQRYIFRALGDLNFVFAYIDDILIASSSHEEHEDHLKIVFQRLKDFSLRINPDKCQFGKTELEFLGYWINHEGCRPTPDKVRAITEYSKPKTMVELRRFLGMVNFYRKNLKHAAEIQAPLQKFLCDSRKNDKRLIPWDTESDSAFERVKQDLANATLLSHPALDAKTRLVTDASNFGMGASLEQWFDDSWKPLAFFSRKFSPAQCNYSTYDRELTAIYEAVRHFRYFLEGQAFTIITDHKPLIYMFSQRIEKILQRQQRQIAFISQFTTDIQYQPGHDNVVADSLSRVDSVRVPTEFSLIELAQYQTEDEEIKALITDPECSLNIRKIQWGPEHTSVYCDMTGETLRPVIPSPLRERVFNLFHHPAHPSAKVTDRVIRKRYVWPSMRRDISDWCKACPECQQSKVSRHNRLLPSSFSAPDGRFRHVHMDIVGPLPISNGFKYCLTVIDRFSRWPEAVPLQNIEAPSVCRAFFDNWVSRYGSPETLTTDQGSQFESQLFTALLRLIGCNRIRTTAYHPASNGMIERWHRSLKAAIMCHSDREWSRSLSTVLLGLRSNVLDVGASPAEFVFGATLRIPGEFVLPEDFSPDPHVFLEEFREHMRRIKPIPVAHKYKRKAFVFKDLNNSTHVFLRDHAKKALERPYTGPHKILNKTSDRVFEIEVNGVPRHVSIENIKPAFFMRDDIDQLSQSDKSPTVLRTYPRKKVTFL